MRSFGNALEGGDIPGFITMKKPVEIPSVNDETPEDKRLTFFRKIREQRKSGKTDIISPFCL